MIHNEHCEEHYAAALRREIGLREDISAAREAIEALRRSLGECIQVLTWGRLHGTLPAQEEEVTRRAAGVNLATYAQDPRTVHERFLKRIGERMQEARAEAQKARSMTGPEGPEGSTQ